ncbi:GerAB/ArcD/ProY family transporter [Bacillus tuaregi]|uniref:GerAB/ArcD/ProY family transporter n=1 Tax=Bacillus tuaregi TaxID=1816695 RepID=UPI0008F906C4|nr:endospore germination permease [Bacillus tuaregi]
MKISVSQFTLLVLMYTIGSSILVMPSSLAFISRSSSWISSLLVLLIGLIFIFMYVKISAAYPNMTFVEINKAVFGKWLGTSFSILFLVAVFIMEIGVLRDIGDFFITQVMVETPIHSILILFLLAAIYVIRKGIEVLSRSCEIFFPWTATLLLILLLFLLPEMEMQNLQPNTAKGWDPIIGAVILHISNPYSQSIVFLMILPSVNNVVKARKGFFVGVILGGLVITTITAMSIAVLGDDFTARNMYPSYVLGKKIRIGNFVERIEVFVAISWVFSIFFKFTVNYFVLVLGLSQILKLNDYKPLVYPLGFFLIVYSMVSFPNTIYIKKFAFETWTPYSFTFFIILPLFVYLTSFFKTRIKKQARENNSSPP